MKTFLDCALELAALGFPVFPVAAGKKMPPRYKRFWNVATTDPDKILKLWKYDDAMGAGESYNPAISTTGGLIAIDADPKAGGLGSLEMLRIVYGLPDTYEQGTPSSGAHLLYSLPPGVTHAGTVGVMANGIDTRAHHNYVLGAGAETAAGVYTNLVRPVAAAPEWLVAFSRLHGPSAERAAVAVPWAADRAVAIRRAHAYLTSLKPAPDGKRDKSAFVAAAYLREIGLEEADAVEQMALWFRYDGLFTSAEIEHAVHSAYSYASGGKGDLSAEAHFTVVKLEEEPEPEPEEPSSAPGAPITAEEQERSSGTLLDGLNRHYAFTMVGNKAKVMWEKMDHHGKPSHEFLALEDFKAKHAGEYMDSSDGGKRLEVAPTWLRWQNRRSYDAVVFAPGRKLPRLFYNTWRGFAVEPVAVGEVPTTGMRESLAMFRRHILENYCGGVVADARWVMTFFAHMVQKPQVKPLCALVLKGDKGIGKSAGVDRVGALLKPHYFAASNPRYLVGNFNDHLARTLFFVLEEAFWSGSKDAESVLKELVTRDDMPVEQKYREAYRAENFMRIAILGNEDWQVPSSLKERRWAAWEVRMRSHPFTTDEEKRVVRKWFYRMRILMEQGGYRYLLRHLLDYDISREDVDEAPATAALIEQKTHSLSPLLRWWLECLQDGRIVEGDFGSGWPTDPEKDRMRDAFTRYCDRCNLGRSWRPSASQIGVALRKVCHSLLTDKKKRTTECPEGVHVYRLPPLEQTRREWCEAIGGDVTWPE